jgi:hypothetical protein
VNNKNPEYPKFVKAIVDQCVLSVFAHYEPYLDQIDDNGQDLFHYIMHSTASIVGQICIKLADAATPPEGIDATPEVFFEALSKIIQKSFVMSDDVSKLRH